MHVSNRNWTDARQSACTNEHVCNRNCMFSTATGDFITFDLCVHIIIDSVQPEHKKWCINCLQVRLYHHHRPHQVRTTPSFSLAIPHTCNQYEQPVSNKNVCVQWNQLASNMVCMCQIETGQTQEEVHVPMSMYVTGIACFRSNCMFALHSICIACTKIYIVFSLNTNNCALIVYRSSSITTTVPTKCAQLHPSCLQYPTYAINMNSLYPTRNACVQWNELALNVICVWPIGTGQMQA